MRKTFAGAMAMSVVALGLWVADAGAAATARELTLDLGDKVTLKLVQIPAGKFLMGCSD